jgi:LAS superfamily LD-carboxypeptidase LdcB
MAKRRKLKKSIKKGVVIFICLVIILIIGIKGYKSYVYKQSYEYKFLELNYTLEEFNILNDKLDNDALEVILQMGYDSNIPQLVNEKYFLYKNLDRYISYISKNQDKSLTDVVALVNVNRDKEYYDDLVEADISKNEAMLVNKYHGLSSDYEVSDIVDVSLSYSYAGNKLNKEAYEAFKRLADDAKEEGYTILILSSYRTYEYQDKLWSARKSAYGIKKADDYAARAGSSEHETGYAIDVADYYDNNDSFGDTDAYVWMVNNSYKYGYILRYPLDKEDITGYSYEAWHYRYVGVDLATKIYNEGITFDEYYEFYLNN